MLLKKGQRGHPWFPFLFERYLLFNMFKWPRRGSQPSQSTKTELLSLPDEILYLVLVEVLSQEADISIYTHCANKSLTRLTQLKHELIPKNERRFKPKRHHRMISTLRLYTGSIGKITPMPDIIRVHSPLNLARIWRSHRSCSFTPEPLALDVLFVSRRLYNLGMPILYGNNTFHLDRILDMPSFAFHCPSWQSIKHLSLSGFDFFFIWRPCYHGRIWQQALPLEFVMSLHSLTLCFGNLSRLAMIVIESLASKMLQEFPTGFTVEIRMTVDENCRHFDPWPWLLLPALLKGGKEAASPVTKESKVFAIHLLVPPECMADVEGIFLNDWGDFIYKEWLWKRKREKTSSLTASTLAFAAVPLPQNDVASERRASVLEMCGLR